MATETTLSIAGDAASDNEPSSRRRTMLIGEVAEQVGVNRKTIRYYGTIGLLPEPTRTDAGYRDY